LEYYSTRKDELRIELLEFSKNSLKIKKVLVGFFWAGARFFRGIPWFFIEPGGFWFWWAYLLIAFLIQRRLRL
tara:strand:- start:374 stop:592 length:219 start_codon:yes stop_codon:yes gene_type:complete